jgi:mono/diheme cytochrome c family protein
MTSGGLLTAVLILLTIAGHLSNPGSAEQVISEGKSGSPAVAKIPQMTIPDQKSIRHGERIYQSNGCTGCHKIRGTGGTIGPDLSTEGARGRSRDWLTIQIRTPRTHFPDTVMPSSGGLNATDMSSLIDYLLSLASAASQQTALPISTGVKPAGSKASPVSDQTASPILKELTGPAANIVGSADQGKMLFETQCVSCHGSAGKGSIPNPGTEDGFVPALNPVERDIFRNNSKDFADNLDRFIQHGSTPEGSGPALKMPAFGDNNTLTQQQISNIEAYILRLNGADRAELVNPGMSPVTFFFIAIPVFLMIMLLFGGIYRCLPGSDKKEIKRDAL